MPVSAPELVKYGKSSLDLHLKTNPIDQVGTQRPFLAKLMAKKQSFPGGKQYIDERLKTSYGSNFQWYYGGDTVTYNSRDNLDTAQFAWRGAHDGYSLNEDEMVSNGIILTDSNQGGQTTQAEKVQLVNIFKDLNSDLREGFEEKLNLEVLRDGTSGTDAITGLDGLIKLVPTTGTVGGIDQATSTYWRNHAVSGLVVGDINDKLEIMYRACTRNGGKPDCILMGSKAYDLYRQANQTNISVNVNAGSTTDVEGGAGTYTFKGVPVIWDPTFYDLDVLDAPTVEWEKRIYMINTRHLKLRPMEGHDMITRTPPRVYDKYVHYFGLTWKGALTTNRLNAHGVASIA